MGITDWVVLAILVIAGLWGFIAGAKKKMTRLFSLVGAIVLAVMFYAMLGNLLANSFGASYSQAFAEKLLANYDSDSTEYQLLTQSYSSLGSNADAILTSAFGYANVPSFFASFFISKIFLTDGTVALAIGSGFVASIIYAISFGAILLVAFILLLVLTRFLVGGGSKGGIGFIDRLAGLSLGLLKAAIFILLAMMVVIGISYALPSFKTALEEDVGFGTGRVSIGGVFYDWAWQIINAFILPFLSGAA